MSGSSEEGRKDSGRELGEGSLKRRQSSGTEKNELVDKEGEAAPSQEKSARKAPGL